MQRVYLPVWCATSAAALHAVSQEAMALIILDVGLPDSNGFELFKQLQAITSAPVIFLTARSSEVDRVVGLELGADDYVAKPFSPRELTARVRSVLRRSQRAETPARPDPLPDNRPFIIDDERKTIRYLGQRLDLSRYEYRLLKILIERPGRVYTRQELMERAWEAPDHSLERTVDAHIKTLRAKLRVVALEPDPIKTHRGLGYSLQITG
jgi:two-component system, OmpR family, catabolic regulation response regulator CreB